MADSGFADTIREALGLAKSMAICNEPWTSQAHDALDASFAALAGLEAERDEYRNARRMLAAELAEAYSKLEFSGACRIVAEAENAALAASLETTREALTKLTDAALHLVGYDDLHGWYVGSDVHGDNVRDYLLPVVREIVEAERLNLTRPQDATIIPAADQGGQNDGVDSER